MEELTMEIQKKEAEAPKGVERTRASKIYSPNVDIIERDEDIIVIADVPGVDEKSLDITLEEDILNIYGKIETDIPKNHQLVVSEYGIGDYQRSFTLFDEVDKDKIHANLKNGVLKIILPKAEKAKTKKIEVTT